MFLSVPFWYLISFICESVKRHVWKFGSELKSEIWAMANSSANGENQTTTKPPPLPSPLRFSKFFQVTKVCIFYIIFLLTLLLLWSYYVTSCHFFYGIFCACFSTVATVCGCLLISFLFFFWFLINIIGLFYSILATKSSVDLESVDLIRWVLWFKKIWV